MILGFQQLRVPTQFCFAEWRRAVLHGKKPTKLIESKEHMRIDPPPNHKPLIVRKNHSSMPCRYFQQKYCSHKSDHDTNGHTYLYICSICHSQGKTASHSSQDCREAKNY